ncbi:O-antigen ligase family protein [Actinoplanes sp. NPDC048988]|uniref:O-antigen ligase family protein n=1 Tax=Actinoplanes sp. NPDC048988 TaxID=3363901 RepID=UPI0037104352
MTWVWHPRVLLAPGLVLILVAIGGRYTLDRAGFTDLAWVDLRVIGLAVGLVALGVDVARRPRRERTGTRREGWLVAATLFFVFQIASGLWAPEPARVGPQTLDLVLMAVLVLAFYLYATGDPDAVLRTAFVLFYVAAILFALAALAAGPGEQGRYSAFGGGPNVFVRIQLLGVISAIALTMLSGRKLPLVAVPLFLLTAVLSGSRAGLLAGMVVGAAALFKIRGRLRAGAVVAVVGLLAAVTGVIGLLAPPAFTSLFQERFVEQTVRDRYLSDRTDIWGAAWRLAVEHPVAGTGLDGFYGTVGVNQRVEYPHNYVLGVAAEGGLLGLGLLALAVLLWAGTVRGGGPRPRLTGLAVAAAALVALCSLFSGDYYDARLFWLFAALAAAAAVTPLPARRRQAVPS